MFLFHPKRYASKSLTTLPSFPLFTYLSTGPVSFRGVLQLKLALVGPGLPTRFKWSWSASGGAPKVRYEADALVVAPATLAVRSQ